VSEDRRLANWVAQDLEAHLEELATTARAWRERRAVDRPLVTIHLASGARHTGVVLERVSGTLVLQSAPARGELDVIVVPIARIEALTLHDVRERAPAPPPEASSPLELKRRAKALSDQLAAQLAHPVSIEVGNELAVVAPLFESARVALDRVCADELGRAALAERVHAIQITSGASGVTLANQRLVISGPLAPERLQTQLDAVL
jgi:hypothetical protein